MSTSLTWFLKEVSVKELLMCIRNLDHTTGPISDTVFPIGGGVYSWNHKIT